jgi:serine protease Do
MVTADGDVALGRLRGSHRARILPDPVQGRTVEVTCLDKAAVSVLAPDLGAPWLDAEGHILGLLVGADVGSPLEGASGRLRPVVTAAYAVPSEVIRVVWPLLKVQRAVPRVALGAQVRRVSPALRHHVCPDCEGYEILAVQPGSAAARADLEPQDIIRTVDGGRFAPHADLWDVLLPYRPGDRVRLGLLRRGATVEVDVVLGRAP